MLECPEIKPPPAVPERSPLDRKESRAESGESDTGYKTQTTA